VFSKYGASFDFTALEMVNSPNNCGSAPETLVKQTILAAQTARIGKTLHTTSPPQLTYTHRHGPNT
jgi:hypothetical protein